MLVLSRKTGQSIHLGDDITLTVVRCRGGQVRLGIEAPKELRIERDELRSARRLQEIDTCIFASQSAG